MHLDYDLSNVPEAMFAKRTNRQTSKPYQQVELQVVITVRQTAVKIQVLWGREEALLGPTGAPGFLLASQTLDFPENKYATAEQFQGELQKFYDPPTNTELEEYEKDVGKEPITAEDVEAVTDLLRKMYDLDLGLWSHENSTYVSDQVRDEYREKSDAVLAEIRRIVTSWNERQSRRRWSPDELEELKAIVQQLALIPPKRYDAQSRQE